MKKFETIKQHKEFTDIINNCKYVKNKYYVIYYRKSNYNFSRFGIAISKKLGKAYLRNYYKRITRNIIDINKNLFKNNKDYIIMIKGACLESNYKDLLSNFENLLKELNNEEKI
ncbi:MAG: ribonuclease P protein component [Bacilli bacterium]|nr:ribonuclease P protein component [Bacilli bacterium]